MPTYTVQPGDSFFSIAGKLYGNQRYAQQLVEMNGAISLHPGMSINVPDSGSLPTTPVLTYDVWNALTGSAPTTTTSTTPVVVGSSGSPQQGSPGAKVEGAFTATLPKTLKPKPPKFAPNQPFSTNWMTGVGAKYVTDEKMNELPPKKPKYTAGTGFALSNLDNIANPPSAGTGIPLSMLDQLSPNVEVKQPKTMGKGSVGKKKTTPQAQSGQPTPPQQVPLSSLDSFTADQKIDKSDEIIGELQAYVGGLEMGIDVLPPPKFLTDQEVYTIAKKLGFNVAWVGQMMDQFGYKQDRHGFWQFVGLKKKQTPKVTFAPTGGWGGSVQYDDGGGGEETPDLFRVAQGSLAFRVATG